MQRVIQMRAKNKRRKMRREQTMNETNHNRDEQPRKGNGMVTAALLGFLLVTALFVGMYANGYYQLLCAGGYIR
jgi:hypothetical protein